MGKEEKYVDYEIVDYEIVDYEIVHYKIRLLLLVYVIQTSFLLLYNYFGCCSKWKIISLINL